MRQRAIVLVLVLALAGLRSSGATASASLRRDRIGWGPCPVAITGTGAVPAWLVFECGAFEVPRDWDHPKDGPRLSIAVSRLRPLVGTAERVLFTNPGGPGAPGRSFPPEVLRYKRFDVAKNFEVIGVDVRGVGGSTRFSCDGHDLRNAPDIRDHRPKSIGRILDDVELDIRTCQRTGGELGRFINTAQTVHDLDRLRHLLGRDRISYVGFSAGSWLGAYYATYFPGRVERFVLDGMVDFRSPWQQRRDRVSPAYQRRFEVDFLPWVARYHERYELGRSPEEVRSAFQRLRARLVEHPAQLSGEQVTGRDLDWIIIKGLSRMRNFPTAAEKFRALYHGVEPRTLDRETAEPPETAFNWDVFDAVRCNDTPAEGDRETLIANARRLGEAYPLLGWYSVYEEDCVFWDRPPLTMPVPDGEGVPPVLMVNSERDPATPIEGARHAAAGFNGARLFTVEGGEHTSYMGWNSCVDETVEAFLLKGKLPRTGASCPGLPVPAPTDQRAGRDRSGGDALAGSDR